MVLTTFGPLEQDGELVWLMEIKYTTTSINAGKTHISKYTSGDWVRKQEGRL